MKLFSNYNKKDWQKLGLLILVMSVVFALPMMLILQYITLPAQEGAELVLTPFHEANLYDSLTAEQAYQGYIFVYLALFLPYVPLIGYVFLVGFFIEPITNYLGISHLKNPSGVNT